MGDAAANLKHRLAGIDPVAKTATCSVCGPVAAVFVGTARRPRCSVAVREHRAHAGVRYKASDKGRAARARERARRFGLTVEQVEAMRARQGGRCGVCGGTEPGGTGDFHIDHDHATGRVRGFLCSNCNTGLGLFRDNPTLLFSAAQYLFTTHAPT